MKSLQLFSDDYLDQCRKLTPNQIARYLEDFRTINQPVKKPKSILISMKVETDLLDAFKTRAQLDGVPYQARIKQTMRDWLKNNR